MKKIPQWMIYLKIKELLRKDELSVAVIAEKFEVSEDLIWQIKREAENGRN